MVSYWIGIGVIRHSHVGSSSEVSEGQDPKSFREGPEKRTSAKR